MATNNNANDRACSADVIQEGFYKTGEISRNSDGTGYNLCPDLFQIISCTKNPQIKNHRNDFIRSLHLVGRDYGKDGCLSEEYFDSYFDADGTTMIFPRDKMPDGVTEKEKKYCDGQYHLMRTILPHWDYFIKMEEKNVKKISGQEIGILLVLMRNHGTLHNK